MTGWTMGFAGWLWMGAWIVALGVAVAMLVWNPRRDRDRDEPLDVLRSRLARGEITPEEFERARGLLATSSTTDRETNR